jgi:DnaJ-class molecular chaperone
VVNTPNLDKRAEVMHSLRHPHEVLTEFYDWLQAQGLRLAKYEARTWTEPCDGGLFAPCTEDENCRHCQGTGKVEITREDWWEDTRRPEVLFGDFFGLDEDKIEDERRALLDSLRKAR